MNFFLILSWYPLRTCLFSFRLLDSGKYKCILRVPITMAVFNGVFPSTRRLLQHHLPENHNCPGLVRGVWRPRPYEVEVKPRRKPVSLTINRARRRGFILTRNEVINLIIASLVLFFVETGHILIWGVNPLGNPLLVGVLAGLLTGMIFHELAHRQVARRYGLWAKFMVDPLMMLVSLITALSPTFKIIAPGYVGIVGFSTRRQQGIIAAAGPTANLALAVIFYVTGISIPAYWPIIRWALIVNLDIAIFNLIPIPPLDGSKILRWSLTAWIAMFLVTAAPWIAFRWLI